MLGHKPPASTAKAIFCPSHLKNTLGHNPFLLGHKITEYSAQVFLSQNPLLGRDKDKTQNPAICPAVLTNFLGPKHP